MFGFESSNQISIISDSDEFTGVCDYYERKCSITKPQNYPDVVHKNSKYEYVLIDFSIGGSFAVGIAKRLIENGFQGHLFFIINESLSEFEHRYATLILKSTLFNNPSIIFNNGIDKYNQIMDVVFMSQRLAKGAM